MATHSEGKTSSPVVEESRATSIHHGLMSSEDFRQIALEAHVAADHVMKTVPTAASIGILDLDAEDASFQLGLGSERDFEMLSETGTLKVSSPSRTDSPLHFLNSVSPASSLKKEGTWSPTSTAASLDVTSTALELQAALRLTELEVLQLHAQVSSKTQSLEMAQKALVEYEDEVQSLRLQLKELMGPPEETVKRDTHERQLSQQNFVKDLWRLQSGTHRILQSLGEGEETAMAREHQVLKENYKELNERHKELEIRNEKAKLELEHQTCELQCALKKLEECEASHGCVIEENGSLLKERTKLKTQLIQAQEELMCVLAETPDADEEVTTYRRRLKEAQEQREMLYRDLDCARAELAALKSQHAPTEDDPASPPAPTNEQRVLQLREVLNSKLKAHPEMLSTEDVTSDGSDRENVQDAKERIHQLQEALALALEAKTLLEEKVSKTELPTEGLHVILADITELKANFQKERRMALRERTENENLILNLQQEKEALLDQMEQVTEGLGVLQEETRRVQGELANKRLSAEEFKIKSEDRIRQLELESITHQRRLAQVREALDLCLEAKRELEIRVQQSDVILSEWVRSFRMQDDENFTGILRRRIESGNASLVKQAALQAVEHLERLQEETRKRMNWASTGSGELPVDNFSETEGEARMLSVTSHQLRMLRRDLREVSEQRDEALGLLEDQKATDARRFREIQELQQELNGALDQHERLLPQFHEVINSKKEMENKTQQLIQELQQQDKRRVEMEAAVVELLSSCHRLLKTTGGAARKAPSLLESILWTKEDVEEICQSFNKKKVQSAAAYQPYKQKMHRMDKSSSTTSSSSSARPWLEAKPLTEQLKCMVDKERDLRRYFDSQSEKLSKMRIETEQRSLWVRCQSGSLSTAESDYPATEMQVQERSLAMKRLSEKDEEISELLTELRKVQVVDQEVQMLLSGLDHFSEQSDELSHPMTMDLTDRLNRLQECAGSLEEQLKEVKSENKQLRAEKQFLLHSLKPRI